MSEIIETEIQKIADKLCSMFPKQKTFIFDEINKLKQQAALYNERSDFLFDKIGEKINEQHIKGECWYSGEVEYNLNYNEYLKENFLKNLEKFLENIIQILNTRENLKDYE